VQGFTSAGWILFRMTLMLASVVIAWYALASVKWGIFIMDMHEAQGQFLRLLIAIGIGWMVYEFIATYMDQVRLLQTVL
jgi:uncharacterized membrane protein YwzB